MDKAGITPFDQKGRTLTVNDTHDVTRQNWIKDTFVQQGAEEVSQREAEHAAEALSKEIMEYAKNIREHQEKYESVMKEMKEMVQKREERMEQMKKDEEKAEQLRLRNEEDDKFFEDLKQYESDQNEFKHEEEMARQEKLRLDEEAKQIAAFKEETDMLLEKISTLQEEANLLANEKSIIETMQMFKNENSDTLEISLDELKSGQKPGNSAVWTFLDSLGKVLSAAWTGIANYFTPPEPTNQPEKAVEIAPQEKQIDSPKLDGPTKR
jgi:chromosome segregation ATPase